MMNERIKELALRASKEAFPHGSMAWMQTFAELIVAECANICKTVKEVQVDNATTEYQLGREMGAEICYNQIRKHFRDMDPR